MRLNVLFAAKLLVATLVRADPLVLSVWPFDELRNIVDADVGLLDRSTNFGVEMEVGY